MSSLVRCRLMLRSMSMIHLLILAVHLLATIAKLLRLGGVRSVMAESLLLRHQLIISSRARRRAPNLNSFDRFVLGLGSLFVPANRFSKLAVVLKPRTLLRFHEGAQETQISVAFLVGRPSTPRPKRAIERAHQRDRRVQAPQSPYWLSSHPPGDCACLWHRYRQRHRPPRTREALSTRSRNRWPVLAELYRAYEGEPVERRFVSLRIYPLAQPLGHGCDGRVHTSDHWLWR